MYSEKDKERFPKNAPGPFYVANGECITCMAPEHEAPDLMAFDEKANHCYFKKQPSTPEELERAARAVWASCCEAVRYSGDDAAVLQMIEELRQEARNRVRRRVKQQKKENGPWWKFW